MVADGQPQFIKQAQKALTGSKCEALSWEELTALPQLHWTSGELVPPEVIRGFVAAAHKKRSPEPHTDHLAWASLFERQGRGVLAEHLLLAWIRHDTERPGGWNMDTYELIKGSTAIAEKGLLAVVAALGDHVTTATAGPVIADIVQAYLKEHYGNRAAQCRALLQMLGWIEDPGATLLLLTTAARFRTPSIRKEADKQANALAARKGWTVDDLADRTTPSAGLDEKGELHINYGARAFTARLDATLDLVLTDDATGATLKTLPEPRKGEDEAHIKAAKADYSKKKKELNKIAKAQVARLYEAMCTQRTWSTQAFREYVLGHPILGRIAVWTLDQRPFRPLGDGGFTAANHDDVKLEGLAIQVAHALHLSEQERAAWTQHLQDFEVLAPFAQLSRPVHRLAPADKSRSSHAAYSGVVIEAFKLRSRAQKLGYDRGRPVDGGWFNEYEKTLPGLGIQVILGFEGNSLPEENREVALGDVSFVKNGEPLPLSKVPPTLFSEAVADMEEIASLGKPKE
jgi:hypothetical protein